MNLPCIKNKCIVYPICMHKKEINCKDLLHWFRKEDKRHRQSPWGKIEKVFPKLQYIDDYPILIYAKGVAPL